MSFVIPSRRGIRLGSLPSYLFFACLAWSAPTVAEEALGLPDVMQFRSGDGFAYAPNLSLGLEGGSTIEFWVAAGWRTAPEYDPVIVSNFGSEGVLYLVAMLRDRQGLSIQVGEGTEIVSFDFADDRLHYVVVQDLGDSVAVLVDMQLVGELDLSFQSGPSHGFFIGSADGATAPFVGALAGLRIWQAPLELDVLAEYADKPSSALGDHPAAPLLVGHSDFDQQQGLILTEAPESVPFYDDPEDELLSEPVLPVALGGTDS